MKKIGVLVFALLGAILSSCSSQEMVDDAAEKLMSAEVLAEGRKIAGLVIAKDTDGLKPYLHESLKTETFDHDIAKVWAIIPGDEILDVSLAGAHYRSYDSDAGETVDYTFQYQYHKGPKWLMVLVVMREQAETRAIIRLHVTPLEGDLREIHRFDLIAATPTRWLWFCLLILNPLFIVFTFVTAFRMRKSLKRPKRWLFFIIIGIGQFALNWTTGEIGYGIATFGLLGAGFVSSGPHAPWVIELYFPLGAALFWFFKKTGRLARKDVEVEVAGAR